MLQENQEASKKNLALFNAASCGSLAGVDGALAKGAKPDYFHNPEDSKNALHVAAENGKKDIVESLLNAGAQINAIAASSKNTALILAASNEHEGVVKLLLSKGADVAMKNMYGTTALHESALASSLPVLKLLIDNNADVNEVNNKGSSALHFVCYEGKDSAAMNVCEALVAAGANIDDQDNRGMTPALVCVSTGRQDLYKFLLSKGANPKAVDGEGRNAKQIAVFFEQKKVAKFLSA